MWIDFSIVTFFIVEVCVNGSTYFTSFSHTLSTYLTSLYDSDTECCFEIVIFQHCFLFSNGS